MTTVLGIETSCDETSAAVVVDGHDVLSNVVLSQIDLHSKYGGVVPEIASRAHLEKFDQVIAEALSSAGVSLDEIDAVAVSSRPGLVICLVIGVTAAKALAWSLGKPLLAVNHVHAHVTSPAMTLTDPPWPAVALVVSGGHTSLYHLSDPTHIELMGATTDDACGEAFDKVSSILGLGYPGGPAVEKTAASGDPLAVDFPRTMLKRGSLDFSFSGIKTAVLYRVHGNGKTSGGLEKLSSGEIADIAASFQAAVLDVLVKKSMLAVAQAGAKTLLAGGGVLANSALRDRLETACADAGIALHLADRAYCTDNAAMIAAHGYYLLQAGHVAQFDEDAHAAEINEMVFTP
jgi:N6-L-threonylcarbamoyladenine synthase